MISFKFPTTLLNCTASDFLFTSSMRDLRRSRYSNGRNHLELLGKIGVVSPADQDGLKGEFLTEISSVQSLQGVDIGVLPS